jgi:hypothetical protein
LAAASFRREPPMKAMPLAPPWIKLIDRELG